MFWLTTALALVSVLAFVIPTSLETAASWQVKALISVGIVAGVTVAGQLPFLAVLAWRLWRRAYLYGQVVRQLDEVNAELVLLKGPKPLRVLRVDRDVGGRGIEMILDLGPLNGVAEGEWLVVLDTLATRVVGRARIARFHAGRCFAEFTWTDPLLEGYLRGQRSPSLPDSIVAFRELDIQARHQRLQELQAEAEQ
jgi:hypothetical protein